MADCPYCTLNTGGGHEIKCPFYSVTITAVYPPTDDWTYIDGLDIPFVEPITQ